jgi:hypothetical protein
MRKEVKKGRRKLQRNEEIHNFYAYASRRMGEKRNAYIILVGNPEGKSPLGRPSRSGWIILIWILER